MGLSMTSVGNAVVPKVDVYIIAADPQTQVDFTKILGSFYRLQVFEDANAAAAIAAKKVPAAIVIDENATPMNGVMALKELARHAQLDTVPLVCTTAPDNKDFIRAAKKHISHIIVNKPFKGSDLLSALSAEVNETVEKAWETKPPVQRKALVNTVSMFHRITDLIDGGQPLPYGEVQESCAPLVEAVSTNQYKGILSGVRDHDNYSYVHSLRVATFLSLFGHTIGMRGNELMLLSSGGLLHDAGKQSIPFDVLNKPGRLEKEEWDVMRSHVTRTIEFLEKSVEIPKGVLTIAAQHHEKLDGSGYPNGLKGGELNDLARMAAIVDVFGALTDRRVYKEPMTPEKALGLMAEEMSRELDMKLLALFREMLMDAATDDGET